MDAEVFFLAWVESAISDPVCLLTIHDCSMLFFLQTGNPVGQNIIG